MQLRNNQNDYNHNIKKIEIGIVHVIGHFVSIRIYKKSLFILTDCWINTTHVNKWYTF
jgi:hypothetical protein